MRVAIGTFARSGIEARFSSEAKAGVEAALRHYTRRLKSSSPPVPVPSFAPSARRQDAPRALDVTLAPEIEATLKDEARRQGVAMDLLAGHAVFVYLADLDASVDDSPAEPAEEDADLPRYQRRCISLNTGLLLAARRHVGSA